MLYLKNHVADNKVRDTEPYWTALDCLKKESDPDLHAQLIHEDDLIESPSESSFEIILDHKTWAADTDFTEECDEVDTSCKRVDDWFDEMTAKANDE